MTNLVREVKEALKDMALSMGNLAQATQENQDRNERRQKGDSDSDESLEDEDTLPVKSLKKSPPKAAAGAASHKCYYAISRGRIPGVDTNWAQAEKQVNGFLRFLHKKFKDQLGA
jgi:hypothetical protein